MKKMIRLLAAVLAAALLLTGCASLPSGIREMLDGEERSISEDLANFGMIPYARMTYERPDLEAIRQLLNESCDAAAGNDVDKIIDCVNAFFDAYGWFYTCYSLSDIHYSSDLTDAGWKAENEYCTASAAEVDAMLESLYQALAKSPCRKELESEENFGAGFFDSYDGDSFWDDKMMEMMAKDTELQSKYYALSGEMSDYELGSDAYYDACADDMAQILVDMITLRQEIAEYLHYPDYPTFAYEHYFYRDYTPEQESAYLSAIRQELVPLYRQLADSDAWDDVLRRGTESQTMNYVDGVSRNMGGEVRKAFNLMKAAGLYDIRYSDKKYNSSFEVYLDAYREPFVFMNPDGTKEDCLTFAHEFGHFCNDYACGGSTAGIDVMEVFSQGMEYLSLCYGEDTEGLTRAKLADSLSTYVEQACYADFERKMYSLTGKDLSVQGLYTLYRQTMEEYGLDSMGYDTRDFVLTTHFYTNPMYIISYVVSIDAAMQIYQMELAEPGAGLAVYQENLNSQEQYFLAFVESAGLESPFAAGRMAQLRKIFTEIL